MIHLMRQEMDELETRKDQELSASRRTIEKLQRERDDASLRYEEEKHKSLMMGKFLLFRACVASHKLLRTRLLSRILT